MFYTSIFGKLQNEKASGVVCRSFMVICPHSPHILVSDLNDSGKVLIGFIAVPEDQNIDELPDMDSTKYKMMISGDATQGATFDPGDYDLKITVQGKATGTLTLRVKPAEDIIK